MPAKNIIRHLTTLLCLVGALLFSWGDFSPIYAQSITLVELTNESGAVKLNSQGELRLSGLVNFPASLETVTITATIPTLANEEIKTKVMTLEPDLINQLGITNGRFEFIWSATDLGDNFTYDPALISDPNQLISITAANSLSSVSTTFDGTISVNFSNSSSQFPLNMASPGDIIMFSNRKFLIAQTNYIDANSLPQSTTYVMQVGAEQIRHFDTDLITHWDQTKIGNLGHHLNVASDGFYETLSANEKGWLVPTSYGYGGSCYDSTGAEGNGCSLEEERSLIFESAITLPSATEWRNNGLGWEESLQTLYFQKVYGIGIDLGFTYFPRLLWLRNTMGEELASENYHTPIFAVSRQGFLEGRDATWSNGVAVALNLKNDLYVCSGTGQLNDPYYLGDGSCLGVNGGTEYAELAVESLKSGQVIQLGVGEQARKYIKIGESQHTPILNGRTFMEDEILAASTPWKSQWDNLWADSDIQAYLQTLEGNPDYLTAQIQNDFLEEVTFGVGVETTETARSPGYLSDTPTGSGLYTLLSPREWAAYGVDYCRSYSGHTTMGCTLNVVPWTEVSGEWTGVWLRNPFIGFEENKVNAFIVNNLGQITDNPATATNYVSVAINLKPGLLIDAESGVGTRDNPYCLTNEEGTIDSCNTAPVVSIDQNSNGESGEGGSGGSGSGPSNIMIEKSGEWGTLSGKIIDLDQRQQLKVEVQIYSNNLTDEEIEEQINGTTDLNPPLFTKIATIDHNGATPTLGEGEGGEGSNWVINLNYDELIQIYENNVSDFLNKSFTQIRVVGFDNKGGLDFVKYEGTLALNTPPTLDYLPPLIQLPTTGEGEEEPNFTHPCEYIDNSTNPPTVTPDFDICLSEEMILRGNAIDPDEGQALTLTITLTNPVTYESITSETFVFSSLSPFPTQTEESNNEIDPTTESGFIISFPFSQLMQLGNSFNITYSLSDSITTTSLTDPLTYTIYPTLDLIQTISSHLPTTFSGTIFSQSPEELSSSGFIHLQDLSADYAIYTQPLWLYHQLSNDTTPNPYPHPFLVKFIPESSKTGILKLKGRD